MLVALCSGGSDSIVMVHHIMQERKPPLVLNINYGQRNFKEAIYAQRCAERLGLSYRQITITGAFTERALIQPELPLYHFTSNGVLLGNSTMVANRNAVFANIAAAVAIDAGAVGISMAIHKGDHDTYSDCTPEFIAALRVLVQQATDTRLEIYAPFVDIPKVQIIKLGKRLNVPFTDTWSCYDGEAVHCGLCSACQGRRNAFISAQVEDNTIYKQ